MKTLFFLMIAANASDSGVQNAEVFDDITLYTYVECDAWARDLNELAMDNELSEFFFCEIAGLTNAEAGA